MACWEGLFSSPLKVVGVVVDALSISMDKFEIRNIENESKGSLGLARIVLLYAIGSGFTKLSGFFGTSQHSSSSSPSHDVMDNTE